MTRSRNTLGSTIAMTALLALTACGGGADQEASSQPNQNPTSASTSSSASESPESPTPTGGFCARDVESLRGPGVQEFGQDAVDDAYCEVGDLLLANSFVPDLIRAPNAGDLTAKDFAGPRSFMAPDAQKDWDAAVKRVTSGNSRSGDVGAIWSLMYYSLYNDAFTYFPESSDEPEVMNFAVSPARAEVDKGADGNRLQLKLTVTADMNWVTKKDKTPYLVPIKNEVTLWLVPTDAPVEDDHTWLIDGYKGLTTSGEAKLRA